MCGRIDTWICKLLLFNRFFELNEMKEKSIYVKWKNREREVKSQKRRYASYRSFSSLSTKPEESWRMEGIFTPEKKRG